MSSLQNIVLIGFMGCGKTTIGKWISQNADMSFYDTDEYIENKENREIKEIFASDGEEYFRDLETEAVHYMNENLIGSVISVGGGLPIRQENRERLKKLGLVVYLRTTEENLFKRLSGDVKRPLLAGADIKTKIHEMMLQRESLYEDIAQVIIDTDEKTPQQIYNEIEDFIFEKTSIDL